MVIVTGNLPEIPHLEAGLWLPVSKSRREESTVLESYRQHLAERAAQGVAPKPLSAEQVAGLVELLKNPPVGEEEVLLDLLANRIPPGVDEAAYVKAGFLSAVAKGEA